MKRIKKCVPIMLSLAILFSLLIALVGCGSKQDSVNVASTEMTKVAPTSTVDSSKQSTPTDTATGAKKKIVIVEENTQSYVVDATKASVEEFNKLGYRDGQTAEITIIHLNADESKSADAVSQIKEMKPDVVLVNNDRFAQNTVVKPLLDSDIPVVVKQCLEDTSLGVIDSLEKPGHNITGMVTMGNLLLPSYQLLNKIAPINGKKACFLTAPGFADFTQEKVEKALREMNIPLKEYKVVKNYEEMQEYFSKWNKDPDVGWILFGTWPFVSKDNAAVDLNSEMKWYLKNINKPAVTYWEICVQIGTPAGLAVDLTENGSQMADIAKEILNGKKPADIPVQEPRRTNIILNMKRINDLGLKVPNELLGGSIIYKDYEGHKAN